ncbi:B12-binding domain-containing protein [Proteocatella sphenisci]|uniref:B12-binding domain-containing protein n=1 Tax=Proteocatella sphenisci TaxID=181070 RepID=UPI0004B87AF9|nr:B12-binding domain-containing protein [Proteocatella sphenisci]
MVKFGSNLKKYRKINCINQLALANRVGLTQGTIANYESGNRMPTVEVLIKIAESLNISVDELLGYKKKCIKKSDSTSFSKEELIDSITNHLLLKEEYKLVKAVQNYYKEKNNILHIFTDIITPAMYKIGELWENGKISVADEHASTEMISRIVDWLAVQEIKGENKDQCAISMSISSEQHTLGIKMVASYLDIIGYRSIYMGNNLPANELIAIIKKEKPKILALSVTLKSHQDSLVNIIKLIREIDSFSNIDILVGGQGIDDVNFSEMDKVHIIKKIEELKKWNRGD